MKVLISQRFGAGWSTWNTLEMATDKDLIELFEQGADVDTMEQACIEKGYGDIYGDVCTLGFNGLKVVEVPQGSYFKIREYDGLESIEILDFDEWLYAED